MSLEGSVVGLFARLVNLSALDGLCGLGAPVKYINIQNFHLFICFKASVSDNRAPYFDFLYHGKLR